MTPTGDHRHGIFIVAVKRPGWCLEGSTYVGVSDQTHKPTGQQYSNVVERANLPKVVWESMEGPCTSYWRIKVDPGKKIQFLEEVTEKDYAPMDTEQAKAAEFRKRCDDLLQVVDLELVNPDKHRPMDIQDDEYWEEMKAYTTDLANGRV